ncbi:MAG TPA: PAS domain S-box protein, partial [Bacteroidota bacterium]
DANRAPGTSASAISWVQDRAGNEIPVEISGGVVYVQERRVLQGIFRDLRDRLQAEERRLAAERKYRAVVENSLMGICIIQRGRFTYVNPQFARLFGYSETEILGLPSVLDVVTDDDRPVVRKDLANRLGREVSHISSRFRGRRKDGREILVEVHGSRIGHNGETSIVGTVLDITERVRAEDALRRSEQENRQLVEQSPIGIMKAAESGVISLVNPRVCSMLGFSAGELVGKTVFETYHPDEVEAGRKRMEHLPAGGEVIFERRMRRKDGSYIITDVNLKRLEDGSWQAMFVDITQRKQWEGQLRKLSQAVEQSPVSIFVTDLSGAIEYVNPKFTQVTQYTSEEVIGKTPRILKSGHTSAAEYEKLWTTITSGGTWKGELHNRKKNGDLYWEDATISPIRGDDGTITHFLAVKEDITARKLLEDQIFHAQRMESLGTLAGGIAHDLNNVLAPILLSLHSVRGRVSDPAALRLLKTVEASANRGKEIVRQVLTFSRAGAGERDIVEPGRLLAEIRQLMNETFPKDIDVSVQYPNDLRTLLADHTQIHQLLMNLCVNARDAMPRGGQLTVTAKNVDVDDTFAGMQYGASPGQFVLMEVSDSGSGIPEEHLSKIFDPFFTTKAVGSGTGLGLSTVHTIVKNHSGFIRVRSTPKQGTTFSIYLPAQPVSAKSAIPFAGEDVVTPRGNGETILIVDDEPSVLESAKMTLESNGYGVMTAGEGTEAIAVYAKFRKTIRIVLVDLMMPFMDGISTVRSLAKLDPTLIFIASSGALAAEEKWASVKEFVTEYIPKPYTGPALLATVGKVLTRGRD